MDDINRWYNTSVYQRSNKATKEWCNKQKHIGIRTLACKPARAPTCLPSSLPACRHTDRRTCRQAIRKRAGSNMMWKRYGIKSKTVLPIFISKMCNKCTIMIRCRNGSRPSCLFLHPLPICPRFLIWWIGLAKKKHILPHCLYSQVSNTVLVCSKANTIRLPFFSALIQGGFYHSHKSRLSKAMHGHR